MVARRKARHSSSFFGMIRIRAAGHPARLASAGRDKTICCSARKSGTGDDYTAGVKKVLPQYDNAPTREWLLTLPARPRHRARR